MISVYVTCPTCAGHGWMIGLTAGAGWSLCRTCDGLERVWAPGAPSYGLTVELGHRVPGEIVTLGNGDRGRILWHSPRGKDKKHPPTTTFLGLIDDFGFEDNSPTRYPSCVGVSTVTAARGRGDDDHLGDRGGDAGDPMQRNRNAEQLF